MSCLSLVFQYIKAWGKDSCCNSIARKKIPICFHFQERHQSMDSEHSPCCAQHCAHLWDNTAWSMWLHSVVPRSSRAHGESGMQTLGSTFFLYYCKYGFIATTKPYLSIYYWVSVSTTERHVCGFLGWNFVVHISLLLTDFYKQWCHIPTSFRQVSSCFISCNCLGVFPL